MLVPEFYLCQLSLNGSGMADAKTYRPFDISIFTGCTAFAEATQPSLHGRMRHNEIPESASQAGVNGLELERICDFLLLAAMA
jgi:hypothetical protein